MSPILVRPVREQLEHDRIIRLLQAKCRRRYEAGMNPGTEQNVAVRSGTTAMYPDLVLLSQGRGRRLEAVVEVETGESVNHLEALAQWARFAKLRGGFHLYVPSTMVDVARRLCEDNQISVTETWSYHAVGEDVRFTLVQRTRDAASESRRATTRPIGSPRKLAAAKRPTRSKTPVKRKAPSVSKPARSQKRK